MWQSHSEHADRAGHRAPAQEFFRLFGYSTKATYAGQSLNNGGKNEAIGDEVLSAYWQAADPTAPVKVTQLAAYHSQGNTETIKTFLKSNPISQSTLFTHDGLMGQSILPTLNGSRPRSRRPTCRRRVANTRVRLQDLQHVDGRRAEHAGRSRSPGLGHYIRIYPAKDADGTVIPNPFLLCMDYYGINYDYQDNIYLVTNMRPANPGAADRRGRGDRRRAGSRSTWAANTESTASGYNVYRSDSATGTFVKVNSGPVKATEFLDATAPGGVTSYYKVTAADDYGGESAQSAVVSAARGADDLAPIVPQRRQRHQPGRRRARRLARQHVDADLAGYKVYRSLSARRRLHGAQRRRGAELDRAARQRHRRGHDLLLQGDGGRPDRQRVGHERRSPAAPAPPRRTSSPPTRRPAWPPTGRRTASPSPGPRTARPTSPATASSARRR